MGIVVTKELLMNDVLMVGSELPVLDNFYATLHYVSLTFNK